MKWFRDYLVVTALLGLCAGVYAQAAKPAAKPAAQASGQAAGPMAGGSGKVGTPYKLGKAGDELHFTLEKAEFATRFISASGTQYAPKGNRFLVVTFSVQNPHKSEKLFFGQSFKFTVVSPDDENYEGLGITGGNVYHPDRRDLLNVSLKPVQKVKAMAFVKIHPNGPVNKLIVARGQGTPVLRYDLKELVKPMEGAFASLEGLGSIDTGLGVVKVPFELGTFDVTVESVEDSEPIPGHAPSSGQKTIAAVVVVRNAGLVPVPMHSSIITAKLFDEDGSECNGRAMFKMSAPESLNMQIQPASQVRMRLIFHAPAAAKADRLVLRDQFSERSVSVMAKMP